MPSVTRKHAPNCSAGWRAITAITTTIAGTPLPDLTGREVRSVAVDGGALEVEILGTGPPLLLLHGWALDRRVWTPQAEALAGRYLLIMPDRRGFGRSTAPADLSREAGDLVALLDALGVGRAAVVAMSQATRVALAFAAAAPRRVEALVLQGTPWPGEPAAHLDEAIPIAEMQRQAGGSDLAAMQRVWRDHPLLHVHAAAAAPLIDAMVAAYDARDLNDGTALAIDLKRCAEIDVPILLLTGEHDSPARHQAAAMLASLIPGAELAEVAGGGHLCNLCVPDTYAALVDGFLSRGRRAGG